MSKCEYVLVVWQKKIIDGTKRKSITFEVEDA